MALSDAQREELLSFNNAQPFIITKADTSDDCETYNVTLFVRTIISPLPEYTDAVSFVLSFPSDFPHKQPTLTLAQGRLFHPNFTDKGNWLCSDLMPGEALSDYLMRLVNTLEFKEIDTSKLANRNAMAWYNEQKKEDLFPSAPNNDTNPVITIHKITERAESETDNGTIPPITIHKRTLQIRNPQSVSQESPRIQLGEIHYE